MAARRGRVRWAVLACCALAVSLLAASGGSASGAATRALEVNVMNEPIRGGEPEVAVNPRNLDNLVLGHTVVGNTFANNTTEAGEEAANGGLQVSNDGGKTWTADRPLHTSGYSEPANPYLIAHGFPSATGYTSTTNGVGDPIEASGPDGSIYAGGVMVNTTPRGPPPFNFTVPQGGIAVARSSNGGRTFGPISAVLTDQEVQGMVGRGMTPKGIPKFGVIPYDRPWIAVDQSTGAELLVKVLPTSLSLGVDENRFAKNLVALGDRLSHAGLVVPHGGGRAGSFVYHTRPFVQGTTLRAWLARHGELPLRRAVEILHQVLAALAHAHAAGVAHGDLKPEHVLLADGQVLIADTGIFSTVERSLDAVRRVLPVAA